MINIFYSQWNNFECSVLCEVTSIFCSTFQYLDSQYYHTLWKWDRQYHKLLSVAQNVIYIIQDEINVVLVVLPENGWFNIYVSLLKIIVSCM